jgi:hypothetical protein
MNASKYPLLDLRQGRTDEGLSRAPEIPLPYPVEIETQTLGALRMIQCRLTGEVYVTQLVDGFTISLTEMARAGYGNEASALHRQYMYRATLLRIEAMQTEIAKLQRNLTSFVPTKEFTL